MLAIEQWDANKFWSEDFITGITAFLAQVNDGIAYIEKEVQFYQWFIDDWSTSLLNELGKRVQDTDLVEHEALCGLLAKFKKTFDVEQLETVCLRPLVSNLKQAKRWRDEMEKLLKALYSEYSKDLKAMREALQLYNKKVEASPAAKNAEGASVNYPIELDVNLKFVNDELLREFLETVKQSMPVQKKGFMNYLGIEGKSSFQGKQLMEAIKKNSGKLDTSRFNLDRLGQKLLDLDLVREDALAIARRPFDQEAYYSWVESSSDKPTLGNWVRGLSTTAVENTPIETLETRYFEKCCKLEYSRYELEKAIYGNLAKYSEFSMVEIDQTLRKNRDAFSRLYAHTKNETKSTPRLVPPLRCYVRSTRLEVIKWEISRGSMVQRKMMLGSDEIDSDAVEAIHLILSHVKSISEETDLKKRISMAWRVQNAMEMGRAINLKIELIKTFKDTPNATNVRSVQGLISSNRYPLANDWILLVKLWLLELPDSLITPKCIEMIMKDGQDSWMDHMPTNNLLLLSEICLHFQWLGNDFRALQGPISHCFMRRVDCIRNFHEDCKRFEPWLITFLTEPYTLEKLQQALEKSEATIPMSPSPPAIQILDLEHPTTPPSTDPDEPFQPRPFRSASAASSLPGSPIPSRSSRRISGLVIEATDPTSNSSHLTLD